jgi:hypothetical protein
VGINAHRPNDDARTLGFDMTLNFQPQLSAVPGPTDPGLKIYDYTTGTTAMRSQPRAHPTMPCVMVSWDNTPRRGREGIVFVNATPAAFGRNLRETVGSVQDRPEQERLVVINAWNEWAEGNYLEPDLRDGTARLEAVREAVLR